MNINSRTGRLSLVCLITLGAAPGQTLAQTPAQTLDGKQSFQSRCAGCHGTDGNGGEHAPSILARVQRDTPQALQDFLKEGAPLRGMPAFGSLPAPETAALVAFLRTLAPPAGRGGGRGSFQLRMKVETTDGKTLEGIVLGQTGRELQLRTADDRIHLLRSAANDKFREATSQSDWPSFHGQFSGNRYSTVTQINKANVSRLVPKWVFPMPNTGRMQGTPIVVEGVMYVPSTNTVVALDAGSGARLWAFTRPATQGLQGNARSPGNNRGLSVAGDKLFMQTDDAHLLALNRFSGKVLWDIIMADWRQNYNATGSLLAIENLVVAGTAGGEEGVRGFLAAYDQETGKEVWRFWTVPAPGEKGSETWDGKDILHGGGPTWLTGSYDPETRTVYWTSGNAGPDFNGDNRKGDNLYTCSILALDLATGKLKWHFQTTPHDEWDWDAVEPVLLVDANWQGQPRKLLLQANRNGFLYVLDRISGKMLLAKPLVKKLTWAKEILPDGRPAMNPNQTPTVEGNLICPAVEGAANFFSTSFSPQTGLFYVNTLEKCQIFSKRPPAEWTAGRGYQAGGGRRVPDEKDQKILRAFNIETGKVAWELPENGQADSWSGTLATAGGVVFFGDDGGALSAADAATGKPLWSYGFTEIPHSSPMTYVFDNKQYVAMAIGSQVYAFSLME
jgi:alcohol dehydrogenase (cytochrome c)